MPDQKVSQLDPFNDQKDEFRSNEIRNSRSRESRNPFFRRTSSNVKHDSGNKTPNPKLILIIIIGVLLLVIVAIIFLLKLVNPPKSESGSVANPAGRESSSERAGNFDDPELRAAEQEKLNSTNELINKQNWQYANAIFKTIYPDYLDDCGRYSYYRAALTLSENIEHFALDLNVLTERMNFYMERCRP